MRLLHVRTLNLQEFNPPQTPPYAILSHTWRNDEVSLQDLINGRVNDLSGRGGYKKILGCCAQADSDGFDYVWIDTCCIDKTSSAELTEAINSMFNWYRDASICYAYLQDVEAGAAQDHSSSSSFARSRWWSRGWTLQELIAPPKLVFLASDWSEIGSRSDLVGTISSITGIDHGLFSHGVLGRYSVAQRMSWAARRHTTRVEDAAYCLLGIFGVTMPLVYGEGATAFIRLQEEIMRRFDDHSLFAWSRASSATTGLLASSPADFAESGKIVRLAGPEYGGGDDADRLGLPSWGRSGLDVGNGGDINRLVLPPHSVTNKGIQITLPIIPPEAHFKVPFVPYGSEREYGGGGVRLAFTPTGTLAVLSCCRDSLGSASQVAAARIGIYLDRSNPLQPYYRSDHSLGLVSVPVSDVRRHAVLESILVRASDPLDEKPLWPRLETELLVLVCGLPPPKSGFRLERTIPVGLLSFPKAATSDAAGNTGPTTTTRGEEVGETGEAGLFPKWSKYGSGTLAIRLALTDQRINQQVGLVFASDRGSRFCAFFQTDRHTRGRYKLIAGLEPDFAADRQKIDDLTLAFQPGQLDPVPVRPPTRVEQGTGLPDSKTVTITLRTKMRPHAALVWIEIE